MKWVANEYKNESDLVNLKFYLPKNISELKDYIEKHNDVIQNPDNWDHNRWGWDWNRKFNQVYANENNPKRFDPENEDFIFAEENGKVVGILFGTNTLKRNYCIIYLEVIKSVRGRGIGPDLMKQAYIQYRKRKCKQMKLQIDRQYSENLTEEGKDRVNKLIFYYTNRGFIEIKQNDSIGNVWILKYPEKLLQK